MTPLHRSRSTGDDAGPAHPRLATHSPAPLTRPANSGALGLVPAFPGPRGPHPTLTAVHGTRDQRRGRLGKTHRDPRARAHASRPTPPGSPTSLLWKHRGRARSWRGLLPVCARLLSVPAQEPRRGRRSPFGGACRDLPILAARSVLGQHLRPGRCLSTGISCWLLLNLISVSPGPTRVGGRRESKSRTGWYGARRLRES